MSAHKVPVASWFATRQGSSCLSKQGLAYVGLPSLRGHFIWRCEGAAGRRLLSQESHSRNDVHPRRCPFTHSRCPHWLPIVVEMSRLSWRPISFWLWKSFPAAMGYLRRPDAMAKSATKPESRLLICRPWVQRASPVQDGGTRVPESLGFNLDNEEFAGRIPQRKIHILSNNKNNGGITWAPAQTI